MPVAASRPRPARLPRYAHRKPAGTGTIAGIDSGKIASSLPDTSGPSSTSTSATVRPPIIPAIAPVRLKPRQ
jgi:hypothetical protein